MGRDKQNELDLREKKKEGASPPLPLPMRRLRLRKRVEAASRRRRRRRRCTVWSGRLWKRFCNMCSRSSSCFAWAALQLQFSPTACGTLRKRVTKPLPQPAAPDCTTQDCPQGSGHENEKGGQHSDYRIVRLPWD